MNYVQSFINNISFPHSLDQFAVYSEYKKRLNEFSNNEQLIINKALNQARDIYKKFGGKIFASGRVSGQLIYDDIALENKLHWHSTIYLCAYKRYFYITK